MKLNCLIHEPNVMVKKLFIPTSCPVFSSGEQMKFMGQAKLTYHNGLITAEVQLIPKYDKPHINKDTTNLRVATIIHLNSKINYLEDIKLPAILKNGSNAIAQQSEISLDIEYIKVLHIELYNKL